MTKKQLIALADVIRAGYKTSNPFMFFSRTQIDALADFCAASNPQFKRQRWLDYIDGVCGPNGGPIKKCKA